MEQDLETAASLAEVSKRLGGKPVLDRLNLSMRAGEVIVTTFARPGYLARARAAGVRGYLLKDSPVEHLAAAIREVARGGIVVPPDLAAAAWDSGADPLTQRERDALRLADEG